MTAEFAEKIKKIFSHLLYGGRGKPHPSSPAMLHHHTQLLSSPSLQVCWQGKQRCRKWTVGRLFHPNLESGARARGGPRGPHVPRGHSGPPPPSRCRCLARGNKSLCVQWAGEPAGAETRPVPRMFPQHPVRGCWCTVLPDILLPARDLQDTVAGRQPGRWGPLVPRCRGACGKRRPTPCPSCRAHPRCPVRVRSCPAEPLARCVVADPRRGSWSRARAEGSSPHLPEAGVFLRALEFNVVSTSAAAPRAAAKHLTDAANCGQIIRFWGRERNGVLLSRGREQHLPPRTPGEAFPLGPGS